MERVNLLWCPRDCKKRAHETTKWVENVTRTRNGFFMDVAPNVDVFIMNDTFVSLNE